MLAAVVRERITGHLVQAIHDDAFPATADQQAASVDAHERALALAVLLERLLLTTIAQLDSVKIQTRVLRGPAVAHTVYPDPGLRSFGDVDLLVDERHYDATLALLCDRGCATAVPGASTGLRSTLRKRSLPRDPERPRDRRAPNACRRSVRALGRHPHALRERNDVLSRGL